MPQRAIISIPSYGSAISPSDVPNFDFTMYQGDSFEVELDFPFAVADYLWASDITMVFGGQKIDSFAITTVDTQKLKLSLTPEQTNGLPERCYWDIQATIEGDSTYQKTYMRGAIFVTRQATV
jgi:hypothetical protein